MKHTGVLTGRLLKHILRSPDTIITVAITPIAMMLMFVYVFGGAVKMSMPADVNYVNYQLPGILLMAIASGIAYTAYRLFMDVEKGMFPRFNSMPIGRSSVLWSHVLTSLVSNMITVVIIILVALILGFRSSAGILNWLAAGGNSRAIHTCADMGRGHSWNHGKINGGRERVFLSAIIPAIS